MLRMMLVGLVGMVPFLAGVWLVGKANGSEVTRYRQLLLPVAALLYGIVALLKFADINRLIHLLIQAIAAYVPFVEGFNTTFVVACLFNCLFMLGFVFVKLAYRGVLALAAGPYRKLAEAAYGVFYEFDEQRDQWFLRVSYRGVRRLLKALYITAVVLSVLLFCAAGMWPASPAFQNPFYPAFVVLLLGEAYFFLSGSTQEEYLDDIEFDEDEATRIFRYAKLQEVLKHYFEDRLLHTLSRGRRRVHAASHTDFCENLMHDPRFEARMAGAYFLSLCDKGLVGKGSAIGAYDELNHDAALDTVRLLEGQSVMFASPFYRDYAPYVFLPANAQLMRGKSVLFLYGADGSESGVAAYAAEGLSFVTNIPGMWTIEALREQGDVTPDVGLLSFAELGNTRSILNNAEFLRNVGFVVVLDPSSLIATHQVGLSILAEYLSEDGAPTYCIFDRNSDGLVDSLSHALRTHLVEVGATEYCEGASVGMFWNVDGAFLQHRLFPDVARYLGVGSEIGLVALKKQVAKVSWAADSSAPLADQRWILGQYYGEIFGYANVSQQQLEVDERFEFFTDLWSMGKRDNRFVIAEDECCNLFEVYRQFATRGTSEAFVNVLSPNYLLRSYMASNADLFVKDPKAVPSFAPDFSKSRRNAIFSIVMLMAQGERLLGENEIRSRLKYVGISVHDVYEALVGLLVDQFEIDPEYDGELPEDHLVVVEKDEYVPEEREIVTRRYYGLSNKAQYSSCFRLLRNVPLITEEPDGGTLLLGSRLYGHLYQSILPGQFLTIKGKYYQVISMSEDTGAVLRRAADHFSRRRYYRQLRSYAIDFWGESDQPGDMRTVAGVRLTHGSASITVSTSGYLDMSDYGDVCHAHKVELPNIPTRSYRNKDVLRIDFEGASKQATATIAVLMSEIFRTWYPQDYHYIAVLIASPEAFEEGVLPRFESPCADNSIYIVEDSLIDIGLLSSIDRTIERLLELCWDYLDWHGSMMLGNEEESESWDTSEEPSYVEPSKRKGFFGRLASRVRSMFGRLFGRSKSNDRGREGSDQDAGENRDAPGVQEAQDACDGEGERSAEGGGIDG